MPTLMYYVLLCVSTRKMKKKIINKYINLLLTQYCENAFADASFVFFFIFVTIFLSSFLQYVCNIDAISCSPQSFVIHLHPFSWIFIIFFFLDKKYAYTHYCAYCFLFLLSVGWLIGNKFFPFEWRNKRVSGSTSNMQSLE